MSECYVGRQPILDQDLRLHAYELLFRHDPVNQADFNSGDSATSQVLLNAFLDIGLERVANRRTVFVNLTRQFIVDAPMVSFPHEHIVLEVLEDIAVDDSILDSLHSLKQQGFMLALDDFILRDDTAPMVEFADYVKLDILALSDAELRRHVEALKPYGVKLLAEKVETHSQYETCRTYGFDYFQGYFFSRPEIIAGRRPPSSGIAVIRLLSMVSDPNVSNEELERIIIQDGALSMRVVRFVNSAMMGLNRRVGSIREAIILAGRKTIRDMSLLIAMARLASSMPELMVNAMVRARTCELLAGTYRMGASADVAFTVGLFSMLDVILGVEMPVLLAEMALGEEVEQAILERTGSYGEALQCALMLETGELTALLPGAIRWNEAVELYLDALEWADNSRHVLN